MTRRMLFRRDFHAYYGGHGKVWDYFQHAEAHPGWQACVYLTPESTAEGNPWLIDQSVRTTETWSPTTFDALFMAGQDWLAWPPADGGDAIPVINLIQHVRHANPDSPLRQHLVRRAIRICVSTAVAEAIQDTSLPRGPVLVIPAAVNLPTLSQAPERQGIVIGATKHPQLGYELAESLSNSGYAVRLLDTHLPRTTYLEALASAKVAILLPHEKEGFYLPALEAMALGCAVVVPDCLGNREYIRAGVNALVPSHYTLDAINACVLNLCENAMLSSTLTHAALETAAQFNLGRERAAFHRLLDELVSNWRDI